MIVMLMGLTMSMVLSETKIKLKLPVLIAF